MGLDQSKTKNSPMLESTLARCFTPFKTFIVTRTRIDFEPNNINPELFRSSNLGLVDSTKDQDAIGGGINKDTLTSIQGNIGIL